MIAAPAVLEAVQAEMHAIQQNAQQALIAILLEETAKHQTKTATFA